MTSEMAEADIETLWAEGLKPSVKDIVRLNALAVKYERVKSQHSFDCCYMLPRVAFIDGERYLRQPSIGHSIWLSKARISYDFNDYITVLTLNSYCLSHDVKDLVDPYDRKKMNAAMLETQEWLKEHTERQMFAAIDYVKNGLDGISDEIAAPSRKEQEELQNQDENISEYDCVAAGVLANGIAYKLGLTPYEMSLMTRERLEAIMTRAFRLQHLSNPSKGEEQLGEYYRTLDSIRERLNEEKNKRETNNG